MRLRAYQKLFLSYLLLIALLVVGLSVGVESLMRRSLLDGVERRLNSELALAAAYYDASAALPPDAVADLLGARSGHRVTVIAPDGRVLGESRLDGPDLATMENHAGRPEVRAARLHGRGASLRPSDTLGGDLLYAALLTRRGDVIRVAAPVAEVDAAVSRMNRGILEIGAVAVLLAILFSFGFSFAVARPLRRLTAAARAVAAGDLSVRLRERRRDELGELARSLDALTEELQHRLVQLDGERVEMQALIDSMSEGVLALAPNGTVRRANPAARRMFALGRQSQGIAPEAVARRPEFLRIVRRALEGESVPPTELASDGRTILATAHPLPDGGAVLVFLDVSELRRLEGVRRDFVANASHELKTPLTAIRGYSETMLDPELPPELVRKFADVVKVNADRLQRIVDDLLDLSRIESGGWKIEPEDLSLAELAAEAWGSESAALESKHVDLTLHVDATRVFADPGALRQVFCNLFSNALRYTPDGGSVSVRAALLPPGAGPRAGADGRRWVQVEVSDTGSGIPSVHLPRIFERFYRVDPARSRADGGTGLGLAIVKHLVESHGGRIEASSGIGRGMTIRFTLPTPRA